MVNADVHIAHNIKVKTPQHRKMDNRNFRPAAVARKPHSNLHCCRLNLWTREFAVRSPSIQRRERRPDQAGQVKGNGQSPWRHWILGTPGRKLALQRYRTWGVESLSALRCDRCCRRATEAFQPRGRTCARGRPRGGLLFWGIRHHAAEVAA